MLFNSFQYLLFLPIVVLLYFATPIRVRWVVLLTASYFFYMCWNVKYALLIFLSTVITYLSGILIEKASTIKIKKLWVALSFSSNLGILFIFKYFNFVVDSIQEIFNSFGVVESLPTINLLLPVGISFYTFQALSYTVDVYRGELKATKHFGKYALFVSFFPQLVAGPIERSKTLLTQFDEVKRFNYIKAKNGFVLILWGMFKKVVIADRLAMLVNTVYNDVGSFSGLEYILATVFFSIQIYCDFSGYSDVAIGSANIMGYDLMKNFDTPYFSKSIGEFWRRWHISLSTWFRDYLYIPLGGSRVSKKRWIFNIVLVFLVSGLWHGASWTFVIWGVIHGIYQVVGKYTRKPKDTILKYIGIRRESWIYTVGAVSVTYILTAFAWIFFRANTLIDAKLIVCNLFNWRWDTLDLFNLGLGREDMLLAIVLVIFLIVVEMIQRKKDIRVKLQQQCLPIRWSVYLLLIFSIIMFGIYGDLSEASFIYFQF